MATYVVGDIQGCAGPFEKLLAQVAFTPGRDRLWLAGDLVNRGPGNLRVLRLVKSLGENALSVLGNHDIHLLAVAAGVRKPNRKDTLQDVLTAPDRDELLEWLRHRPVLHSQGRFVLSHAGVPHVWTVAEAKQRARELEEMLRAPDYQKRLPELFGNMPNRWQDSLQGADRLRVIVNYLTRMRFLAADGSMNFEAKESAGTAPAGTAPWFNYPRAEADRDTQFLFGHWAALEGKTSSGQFLALDTGCVWGGCLTLLRLDDGKRFHTQCSASS